MWNDLLPIDGGLNMVIRYGVSILIGIILLAGTGVPTNEAFAADSSWPMAEGASLALQSHRLFATSVGLGIIEINPDTGAVLNSFTAPANQGVSDGLAFDGTNLYFLNGISVSDTLYVLNPDTGSVVTTHSLSPSSFRNGLAYLNGLIYILEWSVLSQDIIVLDPSSGTVVKTLDIDGVNPEAPLISGGLASITNPDALLVTTSQTQEVLEIDPATGVITNRFTHNRSGTLGAATIDGQIYLGANTSATIDIFDRSGNTQGAITVPGSIGIQSLGGDEPYSPAPIPKVTPSPAQSASEGSGKGFSLGSFTDSGDDSLWHVSVNWGDGNMEPAFDMSSTGSLPDRSHTYAKSGVYTATVTVDDGSDSGSASFQVTVSNIAPVVTAPADGTAVEGTEKPFSLGSFTDLGADSPWQVSVDWGDGEVDPTFDVSSTGSLPERSHTYAKSGAYTASVTVDDGSDTGSASFQVAVSNVAPTVTAPADGTALEGTEKFFSLGSFTDPGADRLWQVSVDWGDGEVDSAFDMSSTGSLPERPHTYAQSDVYTATVMVDDGSDSGSASFQITVGGPKGGSTEKESIYLPALYAAR